MNRALILACSLVTSLCVSVIFYVIANDTPDHALIEKPNFATPVRYVKTPTPLSFVATPVREKPIVIWAYVACDQDGIFFANPYCPHNHPPGGY